MYCISSNDFRSRYLAFMDVDDQIEFGYFLTDRETFLMNISNHSKKHPTIFKTRKQADDFIKWIVSVRGSERTYEFRAGNLKPEWIDSYLIPKCGMECNKCNKKHKYKCHNLRNPYQNLCGFRMAKFEDGFKPDEKRLDAPCERCLTKNCMFNMND